MSTFAMSAGLLGPSSSRWLSRRERISPPADRGKLNSPFNIRINISIRARLLGAHDHVKIPLRLAASVSKYTSNPETENLKGEIFLSLVALLNVRGPRRTITVGSRTGNRDRNS